MAKQKQQEFDNFPEEDRAAKLCKKIYEANQMISEGNEARSELQKELTEEFQRIGRDKITIHCDDGKYRTFRLQKQEECFKIKVQTEKE